MKSQFDESFKLYFERFKNLTDTELIELRHIYMKEIKDENTRFSDMLNGIILMYPNVNFGILREPYSIQLLYDYKKVKELKEQSEDEYEKFDDKIREIALKYLNKNEQNMFCILEDTYNRIKECKIKLIK